MAIRVLHSSRLYKIPGKHLTIDMTHIEAISIDEYRVNIDLKSGRRFNAFSDDLAPEMISVALEGTEWENRTIEYIYEDLVDKWKYVCATEIVMKDDDTSDDESESEDDDE